MNPIRMKTLLLIFTMMVSTFVGTTQPVPRPDLGKIDGVCHFGGGWVPYGEYLNHIKGMHRLYTEYRKVCYSDGIRFNKFKYKEQAQEIISAGGTIIYCLQKNIEWLPLSNGKDKGVPIDIADRENPNAYTTMTNVAVELVKFLGPLADDVIIEYWNEMNTKKGEWNPNGWLGEGESYTPSQAAAHLFKLTTEVWKINPDQRIMHGGVIVENSGDITKFHRAMIKRYEELSGAPFPSNIILNFHVAMRTRTSGFDEGISPEDWNLRNVVIAFNQLCAEIDAKNGIITPGAGSTWICSEWGYDTGNSEIQAPPIQGLDRNMSMWVMNFRAMLHFARSPYCVGATPYEARCEAEDPQNPGYWSTGGSLRWTSKDGANSTYVRLSGHAFSVSFSNLIQGWIFQSVENESGGLYVWKTNNGSEDMYIAWTNHTTKTLQLSINADIDRVTNTGDIQATINDQVNIGEIPTFLYAPEGVDLIEGLAQEVPGCTNQNATNYDQNATVDDGSCEFPTGDGPMVTAVYLVNATTNQDIVNLGESNNIQIEQGTKINARAVTNSETNSVYFTLDASHSRTENAEPFSLFGDQNGNYYSTNTLADGQHTITATPYSKKGQGGNQGPTVMFTFTINGDVVDPPDPDPKCDTITIGEISYIDISSISECLVVIPECSDCPDCNTCCEDCPVCPKCDDCCPEPQQPKIILENLDNVIIEHQ